MKLSSATLGELADSFNGAIQTGPFGAQLHQSDYRERGTPTVMPQNIVGDRIVTDQISYVDDAMVRKLARHTLRCGDIVYPRRGDLKKRALIGEREEGWLCGTGCIKISLSDSPLKPKYLYYYLKQTQVVQYIENKAIGATMLNLSASILKTVEVKYPEEEKQQKIADTLSAYDDLIDNNNRRIALLEESIHRLYKEWFVHLHFPGHEQVKIVDDIPEGWEKLTLGNITIEIRELIHPSLTMPNTPYIGLEHIPRRSIALFEWGCSHEVDSNKFKFAYRDILFGKIRPYFHKVVFAPLTGICSSDTIIIRPKEDIYWGLSLSVASSISFVNQASKTAKEGSKMPRANWNAMKTYSILIPTQVILENFNNIVIDAVNQIENLIFMNQKLREARDRLLPRLMSGSITL